MNYGTHVDTLPSGIEFEVKELTGKHQRILTESNKKTFVEKLNEVLADVLVRVGTETHIDEKFILNMLVCDKQKVLVTVRQFTMEFEPMFKFVWEYTNEEGVKTEHKLEIPLEDGNFPALPVRMRNEEGEVVTMREDILAKEEELEYVAVIARKSLMLELPRSGENVRWQMMDGHKEILASKMKKGDRSSHSVLKVRNPVRFDNETPIQLNLDNLGYKDIEALRADIKEMEGSVDTEISFEHPEAESKPANEKQVVLDLLGTLAFFFPSGAM